MRLALCLVGVLASLVVGPGPVDAAPRAKSPFDGWTEAVLDEWRGSTKARTSQAWIREGRDWCLSVPDVDDTEFVKHAYPTFDEPASAAAGTPKRDAGGRLRVFLLRQPGNLDVNVEIVRQGYARVVARPPFPHAARLIECQKRARGAKKGIWAGR